MLSILLKGERTCVSRSFLADFNYMIHAETNVVERFFEEKFVTNYCCENLTKIKWTRDEDKLNILLLSQIFSQSMIESFTAPYDPVLEKLEALRKEQQQQEE